MLPISKGHWVTFSQGGAACRSPAPPRSADCAETMRVFKQMGHIKLWKSASRSVSTVPEAERISMDSFKGKSTGKTHI